MYEPFSAADKLSYESSCAFDDKSMNFSPVLVHTIKFIFRCGGKSDSTSDDLDRSMTSKCQKKRFCALEGIILQIKHFFPIKVNL